MMILLRARRRMLPSVLVAACSLVTAASLISGCGASSPRAAAGQSGQQGEPVPAATVPHGTTPATTGPAATAPSATPAGTANSGTTGAVTTGAGTGTAAGTPVVSSVDHWGSLFGARRGNFDVLRSPASVTLPGTVAQIGTSNSTEYALLTDGSLYAWGMGNAGQLGDGQTANSFTRPVRVEFPPGVRIRWIPTDAMPFDTGLAVDTEGRAWGWGRNGGGELCLGSARTYLTPVQVPLPPVTAMAGASNHALYDAFGTVYACGQNEEGDLGDGSLRSSTVAVPVAGLAGSAVTELVASFANSGALLSNGSYFDWGYNAAGQLGDGKAGKPSDVPVRVHLPYEARQIAQGGSLWNNGQTLALLSDGSVWAWGNDRACQLGDFRFGFRATPVRIPAPGGVTLRRLATGSATSYAVSSTGTVYAWGVSHVGQLGNGLTDTICAAVPVAAHAVQISATADNVAVSLAPGT
jgi:alpha-tubulin suppressor-like RCC1 family protein